MVNEYSVQKDKWLASNGRRLTTGLFIETSKDGDTPSFSLADWRKRYVEMGDPTGYTQSMELVGDWEHWNVLKSHVILKPIFESWDKELEAAIRSKAILSMIKHSKSEKGQASAKWLAEAGFKEEVKRDKRVKENKEQEEAMQKEVKDRIAADKERLGVSVLVGGKR